LTGSDLLKAYLSGRASLRRVFLLIDSRHGVKDVDKEIMDLLGRSAVTFQVVLTKADKPKKAELDKIVDDPDTAMFYTVWSYSKNTGRDVILEAARLIKKEKPHIKRFVTLSPLTDVAERFHLRNGAVLLEKGDECQNFEYILD
jgi:GTP-binding protein EngB required for normal cell division